MSIFDLTTEVSELKSSNSGISEMEYSQKASTRDIVGNNFSNGKIHYKWTESGNKWWVPSRSYMRARCTLAKADGTILDLADDIAPNMNLMSTLFQSAEFRINGKTISRVSDFLPQIDSLENRLGKSKSWLDSTGEVTNWWASEFKNRQADVTSDSSNEVTSTAVVDRLDLGFVATQQFDMDALGLLTQTVDTTVPLNTKFVVGDSIEINLGGLGLQRLQVVGVTANTMQTDYTAITTVVGAAVTPFSRVRTTVSQPDTSRKLANFELTWTPPLSIFKVGHALPVGDYELVLTPQTSSVYQKYAIESLVADRVPNLANIGAPSAGSEYIFNIVDMYLNVNEVSGPRVPQDMTYLIDLESTRCQSNGVDSTSFSQKSFDVSPSTYALTVAYQDARVGTNTLTSSTKFKSYNAAITADEETKLNRFFINYSGTSLPSPDADPSFVSGTDYTIERYTQSQLYSGSYFDNGGSESIQEFHDRGSYYYFAWARDGSDRSTRVNVHQQFNGADITNMRLLLFDHSRQVARIVIQNGQIVDTQLEDL